MLTFARKNNTTTSAALLGAIIATGLIAFGPTIVPLSAFALPSPGNTNVVDGTQAIQFHQQNISSPKTMNNDQIDNRGSNIGKDYVKNSFGIVIPNQNNHQNSKSETTQNITPQGNTTTTTTVTQTAPNLNLQNFELDPTSTSSILCILIADSSNC